MQEKNPFLNEILPNDVIKSNTFTTGNTYSVLHNLHKEKSDTCSLEYL